MGPETPVGLPLPDGGLVVSGRACAALRVALRAHLVAARQSGMPPSRVVLELTQLADKAAADHERRRVPVSAGSAVLALVTSASPRSDWADVRHAGMVLGLSERQIRNLCDSGTLRAAKDNRHRWRIDPQSIEDHRVRREDGRGEQQGSDSG